MSLKKMRKLACEAFNLLSVPNQFSGFVRACQVFGIDVFQTVSGSGVIVRSSQFWVERFRRCDGNIAWNIFKHCV